MYGDCGCGMGHGMRGFLTKKEKLELLKEYKQNLEHELEGVSEQIKEAEKNK